ncbi:MAG: GumC family protein, partial [Pseudomonadota bacterium]
MPDGQMVPYGQQEQPKLIDASALRGILFRQRWLIAGVLLLALIGGLVFTLISTPIYRATTTVKVEPAGMYIIDGQDIDQGFASNQVDQYIMTQMDLIRSRSLAKTVAEELGLDERPNFLGENIDEMRPGKANDAQWRERKLEMAASILKGGVSTSLPQDNWIVEISYVSSDQVFAAEAANAFAEAFVSLDTRRSLDDSEYAQEYLRGEIDKVRERLAISEQAANDYARNSGIITQGSVSEEGTSPPTLTAVNLSSINVRAAEASAKRIEAEQRWRSIQNLPASQLPEVQSNPVLQSYLSERTAKQSELVELRRRYNDEFPQIQDLLAQIAGLDRQIEQVSSDIKATVRNEYIVAQNQEQALEAERASLAGATLAEQDKQVEHGALVREAEALREQLRALLN